MQEQMTKAPSLNMFKVSFTEKGVEMAQETWSTEGHVVHAQATLQDIADVRKSNAESLAALEKDQANLASAAPQIELAVQKAKQQLDDASRELARERDRGGGILGKLTATRKERRLRERTEKVGQAQQTYNEVVRIFDQLKQDLAETPALKQLFEKVPINYDLESDAVKAFGDVKNMAAAMLQSGECVMVENGLRAWRIDASVDKDADWLESNVKPIVFELRASAWDEWRWSFMQRKLSDRMEGMRVIHNGGITDRYTGPILTRGLAIYPSFVLNYSNYQANGDDRNWVWHPFSNEKNFIQLSPFSSFGIRFGVKTELEAQQIDGAKLTGTRWRYANKDGSPDGRRKNNEQLLMYEWGVLLFEVGKRQVGLESGDAKAARAFAELLDSYRRIVSR